MAKLGIGTIGRLIAGLFALGLGLGVGMALVAAVVGFGRSQPTVRAQTTVDSGVIACVSYYTGHARIGRPGQQFACSAGEFAVVLGSEGSVENLDARLTALEEQVPDCLSEDDNADAVFEACNVRVLSGSGATDGAVNGEGNLIIGYNESSDGEDRSGSHNLVIGPGHSYSSYGGFVAGLGNTVSGIYASVTGGTSNTASSQYSSVAGGNANTASGESASVSGGNGNEASGESASVSGGNVNTASGESASVSGGNANTASGESASVSGGNANTASDQYASVSGGRSNTASGAYSSISGGQNNVASGPGSSISGGEFNAAVGEVSSVGGGDSNTANGHKSTIGGGNNNTNDGVGTFMPS